ncbi:hypothetical protein [Agrobacterium larrymoorei]|uniref:Uncharacterized protein n=1 Tax=Agrobacterium larrymoorei TaxID=160699 RepID=A0ABU0ULW5_9HYPH|nr:hypothetical protein [Agrobacterium larrymoorei]MDQ1185951.1 hypothetical protein [Agrobacterium larrymoorei]
MPVSTTGTAIDFERMLKEQFQRRLREISQEEIEAANKRVADRVKGELDKIALSVLQQYDIQAREGSLIITVKKAAL